MNEATTYPIEIIARLLDLTPRRVQQLTAEGYIQRTARNEYFVLGAVQGYIKHLREQIANAPSGPEEKEARRRKLTAEASLAELDLSVRTGEVACVPDIVDAVQAEYGVVRGRLLGIPGKLAGELSAEQVELVRIEIFEALEDLHDPEGVVARLERDRAAAQTPQRSEAPAAPQPHRMVRKAPPPHAKDDGHAGKMAHERAAGRLRSNGSSQRA